MASLRVPEPTILTTPKGEEVVLLTLTRAEWEALDALLSERSEAEKLVAWHEDVVADLIAHLEDLEAHGSSGEKQAWQNAVAKAKPATYIPGQGVVVLE